MKKTPKIPKDKRHLRRKKHVRKNLSGTTEMPRISITRSIKNLYVQVIDDVQGVTLVGMGTLSKDVKTEQPNGGNVQAATLLGVKFAEKVKEKGIEKIVFDRNGYKFHGRVKAFAEALRANGLKF